MVNKLKLKNFRKFKDLEIVFDSDIVVLYGDNAQGKSSILEAIHLITNGNSPWSSGDEYINNDQEGMTKHSRIEIESDTKTFALYKDNNRRMYMINDQKTTSKKFFSSNSTTIFNPEKIDLLMLSPSRRRDFIDETISYTNYEYPTILKRFKKTLRQRNSHLKKLSKKFYENGTIARNDPQLNFWTKELGNISSKIYIERLDCIRKFSKTDFELQYIFCTKEIDDIEKSLGDPAKIGSVLSQAFEKVKKKDIATGYTNVGPHRDDWNIFTDQDIKKYGSRGQKRLAIGNLIFQAHEIIAKEIGYYPTLLLDDIASELDKENTQKIFDKEVLEKQQTFITTVDPNILPSHIRKNSNLINLNQI